jgi:CBS domain-containing protein
MKRHASEIMTTPVITARKDMKLTDAIDMLLRWNISSLPVVDENDNMMGLVTEYDLMDFALDGHAAEATVGEAMSSKVVCFPPDADVDELVNCTVTQRIHRMPIVKDGKVVGIVSRRDILREVARMYSRF